ncbi:LysR family transcriptional regulator, partial [Staphylococcus pasteuri]|uniref:LysR family transcriptional regulator n=2 Tax=Staphylococcus TaxID=1279 RepID=UPI0030C499EB
MKIIQLEYFLAIVKYNSFTKASNFLHISQPSLTATIKKMEADLGYDLFMRTTKDIKITEKGIQFYKYATQLVQEYRS